MINVPVSVLYRLQIIWECINETTQKLHQYLNSNWSDAGFGRTKLHAKIDYQYIALFLKLVKKTLNEKVIFKMFCPVASLLPHSLGIVYC